MAKRDMTVELTGLSAALADETRLRLLNLMREREVCVCYFVEILKQEQPKISRHLSYLRKARLATARREGRWMHYRLRPPEKKALARFLRAALDAVKKSKRMQADLALLDKACCEPRKFVQLSGAPVPARLEH